MSRNPYDQGCRYLTKQDREAMCRWLLGLTAAQMRCPGWIDTRRICFPGEPDRTCDTVALLEDLEDGQAPWAVPIEFQIEPDIDMFARMLNYLGSLGLEARPSDSRGDRFRLGSVVVNLTGIGNCSREMRWPAAKLCTQLVVVERNFSQEEAGTTLDAIEGGQVPALVLAYIPLMRGGGEADIIKRWLTLALAQPDDRRRADIGGLALVFAEATKHVEAWKKALEGWNVIESKQVLEWQAQARREGQTEGRNEGRNEGRSEGRAEALVDLLEDRWGSLADSIKTRIRATRELSLLRTWQRIAGQAADLDQFLRESSLG